jgi:uncharacterized membrane protein
MFNFAADNAPRVIFSASAVAYMMANTVAAPLTGVYITAVSVAIISSLVVHRMSFYVCPDHWLKDDSAGHPGEHMYVRCAGFDRILAHRRAAASSTLICVANLATFREGEVAWKTAQK